MVARSAHAEAGPAEDLDGHPEIRHKPAYRLDRPVARTVIHHDHYELMVSEFLLAQGPQRCQELPSSIAGGNNCGDPHDVSRINNVLCGVVDP